MQTITDTKRSLLWGRPARWMLAVVLGLSIAGARAAEDPDLTIDTTAIDRDGRMPMSHASIVKKVAPSVVTIYSEQTVNLGSNPHGFMDDPFLRRFFGDSVPRTVPRTGLGSGVILTKDGYILTNNHVVEGADKIMVVTKDDKQEFRAEVVGTDPQTDVAVLKVETKNLPAVTIGDSDGLEVGDLVFAVGNPMGVGQTVSMGIVSALGRGMGILGREGYENFIQTDAAINRGNSGGPLVDVEGRLIGVNQSIISGTGGSDGIGFAIPANLAVNIARQLITSGEVHRGYIGINIQSLSPDLAAAFEIDDGSGALVSDVVPDSPGDKAGLKPGDVVVQFDGRKVRDSSHLRLMASQTPPGSEVDLKIIRDGKGRGLEVKLGELAEEVAGMRTFRMDGRSGQRDGLDGVIVEDLTARLRSELDLPDDLEGAIVTEVDRDSNAFDAGLQRGDVIVEINRSSVEDADDAVQLSNRAEADQILLRVWSRSGGRPGLRYVVVDNTKDD